MNHSEFCEGLSKEVAAEVQENIGLAPFTGFQVGGPADLLAQVSTVASVQELVKRAKECSIPLTVLGRGHNVLISDRGIRGLTLVVRDPLNGFRLEGENISAGAGTALFQLAAFAARNSLSGAEFLCGIPGTLGGAVRMNAGAYDGAMEQIVESVEYVDLDGNLQHLEANELDFSYRHSFFSDHAGIVTGVAFRLQNAELESIYRKMAEVQSKRRKSQPLEALSAGSTFKRPEGHFAGKLISDAGLKGWNQGAVGVSAKHAGFVLNHGQATATELRDFILLLREKVFDFSGVRLEPEIRLVGDWEGERWN